LCDAAEGGQILLSLSAAVLLEEEDLGDLAIRDLGEQITRRSGSPVRAFELVRATPGDAPGFTAPELRTTACPSVRECRLNVSALLDS
jgi:class 3 adenylate cyclase